MKPKPTHLRIIAGNPSERPINRLEPKPLGDLSDPPDWLSPSQKDGWRYAIEHAPRGLLKQLDRAVLTVWVIAEDTHREAALKVQQHGMLIKTPLGMPVQSPYLSIQNRQSEIMMRAAAELGFTPSSRTQIQVEKANSNAFANNGRRSVPAA